MSMVPALRDERVFPAPTQAVPLPPVSRRRFARVAPLKTPRGERVTLPDGRELWLRAIAPCDTDAVRRCFTRLSAEEVRMRFMHAMSVLPEPMAHRLCALDPEREAAFVLMDEREIPAEMRGVGRIYVDENANSAEFAVLVERAWTGRGLGALLMRRLVEESRRRGLDELWGYVLIENRPMLDLCRELGFRRRGNTGDPGTAQIALDLRAG